MIVSLADRSQDRSRGTSDGGSPSVPALVESLGRMMFHVLTRGLACVHSGMAVYVTFGSSPGGCGRLLKHR